MASTWAFVDVSIMLVNPALQFVTYKRALLPDAAIENGRPGAWHEAAARGFTVAAGKWMLAKKTLVAVSMTETTGALALVSPST